ncbi:MAG: alpha-amylase family glycosyl hydrolase [Clostridium sp.]|nr:alpha-amylase family glycosyl hydrolase [Clostridium sp.]
MKTRWYKDAVVYQIYPRSFKDSNGDGIGDLNGITEKADYIKNLGVDAVWLSPCYKSPNDDNGYDISDYRDIMDEFGTLDDWQKMLDAFHTRGIKVIMDLVVNHTSDEHKWFEESRKSKDNPYRDYYIWRDGTGEDKMTPPNDWQACFGGSVWEYDETTEQFYLHLFSKKQPDLNWDNPKVRKEVEDICNFWLEKGVDGFRCDVITYISKPDNLYGAKWDEVVVGHHWKKYIKALCENSWNKYDTLIVGEAAGIDFDTAGEITTEGENLLDMLFHFDHMEDKPVCAYDEKSTDLSAFKKVLFHWQTLSESAWGALYYENHDQPRSIPRFAPSGELREKSAKSLAVSLLFQKGTPFIYQGQELGMTNCLFCKEDYKDIEAVNKLRDARSLPNGEEEEKKAEQLLQRYARDHARTPMQWNDSENAGFTDGVPWMKINENYTEINAEKQLGNDNSVLSFYKKAISVRKAYVDIISRGEFAPVLENNKDVFAFIRQLKNRRLLVICSLSPDTVSFRLDVPFDRARLILTNSDIGIALNKLMTLPPCICAVWEI